MVGTWKLMTGTLIENGDTTVTDYTKNKSFIKIINGTHFAFLEHDLSKGKDSAADFVAGGALILSMTVRTQNTWNIAVPGNGKEMIFLLLLSSRVIHWYKVE